MTVLSRELDFEKIVIAAIVKVMDGINTAVDPAKIHADNEQGQILGSIYSIGQNLPLR